MVCGCPFCPVFSLRELFVPMSLLWSGCVKTQNILYIKNPVPKYVGFFINKQKSPPHRVRFWLDIDGNLPLSIFQNSFHAACGVKRLLKSMVINRVYPHWFQCNCHEYYLCLFFIADFTSFPKFLSFFLFSK